MDTDAIAETNLTERQAEVLRRRYAGETQQSIADDLGTTASNVSAVERAARDNVEQARRTLAFDRTLRTPARTTLEADADIHEIVDTIYDLGDDAGIKIAYPLPELFTHVTEELDAVLDGARLRSDVEVGIENEGEVVFYGP
jgi:Tfx family DNA-binding protein